MYQWFSVFLLAIINYSNCSVVSKVLCRSGEGSYCRPTIARHYGPPHNYYHGTNRDTPETPNNDNNVEPGNPASPFETLALNLMAAETAIQNYCRENNDGNVREIYGAENYILKYPMRDFTPNDMSVKIIHRVIYVLAEKPGLKTFKDLRILPSIVDTTQATYVLENNILKVFIPYKMKYREESVAPCENGYRKNIDVPNMNSLYPTLKLREPIVGNQTTTNPALDEHHNVTDDNAVQPTLDEILANLLDYPEIDIRNMNEE